MYKSIKIKSFGAVSILWLGAVFGAALAFLTQALIARNLKPSDFGLMSSILAVVSILAPLASFGVPQFWLKVFGEEGWEGRRWVKRTLVISIAASIISFLFLLLWAAFTSLSGDFLIVCFVVSFHLFSQVFIELICGKFQLEGKYSNVAMWQFFPHLIRFLLFIVFLYFFSLGVNLLGCATVYFISAISICYFGLPQIINLMRGDITLVGHGERRDVLASVPSYTHIVKLIIPFGLAGFFHLVYFQSSIVLLSHLGNNETAGLYNVAFIVMTGIYIFPNVLYQKFLLPKIHLWANKDAVMFSRAFYFGAWSMLALGIIASGGVWIISEKLVGVLFGDSYKDSVNILRFLSLAAPIRFVSTVFGSVLVTNKNMVYKIRYMGLVALLSIFLNFIFIPLYSAIGAVFVTLTCEVLLLLLYLFAAKKFVFAR